MKGPVGPDGWGRFCLGLRARWRRVSEADRQTASGTGRGGGLPRLADSNLSSARRSCIHRAEQAAAAAAGNGVFGPAAPSLFTFTL